MSLDSERKDLFFDALWLAALRWEDDALERVARTLPPRWYERARGRGQLHRSLDAGAKARSLRAIVAQLDGSLPPDARLPPRALALLCSEVERETGRRWAEAAPPPRRGFVAEAPLRRWLRRLAAGRQR